MAFGCFALPSQGIRAQGSSSRADEFAFIHPEANIIQYYNDSAIHVREAWNNSDSTAFVTVAHLAMNMFRPMYSLGIYKKFLQTKSWRWRMGHGAAPFDCAF